jgi:hypothetical protein
MMLVLHIPTEVEAVKVGSILILPFSQNYMVNNVVKAVAIGELNYSILK